MAALPRRAACLALGILALTLTTPATFAWLTGAAVGPRAPRTAHARPAADEVPAGQIVVRGRIDYIDRDIERAHAAAGVRVEIWDQDKGFPDTSSKLGEARTDINGFFESPPLPNQDRDAPGGEAGITGQDIFLKLFTDNGDVKLLQLGTSREFVWQSYDLDREDGIQRNVADGSVTMPRLIVQGTTRDVEALWTFVNMAEAWLFMQSASGSNPGKVTGYWSKESQTGPLYDPAKRELVFRNDTAGYSDVVVQHTAYALLHNIYGTLPAAWTACLSGSEENMKNEIDPACALVQGFATFLPLAVYKEALFDSQVLRRLDLDAPGPVAPGWSNGDRVPGRIAGAFWDLYEEDQTVEEFDTFNATFGDVWEVFRQKNPTTFAEWWAGWKALGKDSCGAVGSLFQNSIDYARGLRVAPIPDVVLDEDQSTVINLAAYVTNADCPPDRLKLTIIDYGAPEAGIESIAGTLMISVTPQANWFGQTTVRVLIADGPSKVNTTFKVIVNSVNDCPRITPRIADPGSVRYGETITIDLGTHGTDVETAPALLQWRADIEPQYKDLMVTGNGTTQLVFSLNSSIIVDYSALVDIVLRDADGCEVRQPIALNWTERPNQPPVIWMDRLVREYQAPVNTTIHVDLNGVAGDAEDGPDGLEWFIENSGDIKAQALKGSDKRSFDFIPSDGYIGSTFPELAVKDSKGLQATAGITLTWVITNAKPVILRNLLLGKTVGASQGGRPSPAACYPLANKATDADDPVSSLLWFLRDYDADNLTVTGQGTQAVCLRPRPGFVGCETARFLVRDPKGGTDSHEVTTCWREIKILLPYTVKPPQSAAMQQRRNGR